MADRIGQQLGSYRIMQLLGQGGFAEVYLGEHLYLKSLAAIKVLQTRLSGADDSDGFLREAQTIARLSHPNIIRVLDFGIDGETPYLVMDYAPNGTLRQRHAKSGPLPLPTILPYVKQVADALQYAHDERLIHRDIKPENMLIGRRNEILLSDFGIALIAQNSLSQRTQDVIGTVGYMSPEQIQGKPRPASDQYSLGIVVYEWLTGERPFHGSFTELCTQHIFAQPPLLTEKSPLISADIERVVMTALAKDPKQRFETVRTFAEALEKAGQGTQNAFQTEIMQPSAPYRPDSIQPSSPVLPVTGGGQTGPNTTSRPIAQDMMTPPLPLHLSHMKPPQDKGLEKEQNVAQTGQVLPSPPQQTLHSSPTVAQTSANVTEPPKVVLPPIPDAGFSPAKPAKPNEGQVRPPSQFAPPKYGNTPQGQPPGPFPPQQQQHPAGPNNFQRPPAQQQHPASPNNFQRNPAQQGYPGNAQNPGQFPPQQQRYGNPNNPRAYTPPTQSQQQQAMQPPKRSEDPAYNRAEEEQNRRNAQASQRSASERSDEGWGILATWKVPIIATIVGIVLFCLLYNFHPVILNRSLTVLLVIPLFFGAAFGPIVGLLVALGGVLVSSVFAPGYDPLIQATFTAAHFNAATDWWSSLLINTIAGLMAGLSMLRRRRFPSVGSATRASILSAIGLAGSIGFLLYRLNALQFFAQIGLIALLNVGVALVLLIVYSIVGRLIDPGA